VGRRATAGAVLAGIALAVGAQASAPVGGPPTFDFNRCDSFLRPCDDPIVVGKARHFIGPVEVVGMHFEGHGGGLCMFFDSIRLHGGFGYCGGPPRPPDGKGLTFGSLGTTEFRKRPITQIDGSLVPEVAKVRASYRREGEMKNRRAAVVQVAGELQEYLQEPETFGVYELTVRGCIPPRRFRITALDSSGQILGRVRGWRRPRFRCRGSQRVGLMGRDGGSDMRYGRGRVSAVAPPRGPAQRPS